MIHETSQLMRTGILAQLLASIKTDILQLTSNNATTATRTETSTTASSSDNNRTTSSTPNIQLIRLKVDIIFFAFYQSQIEEDEARLLLELIKLLSDLLVGRDINTLQSAGSSSSSQPQSAQQFNFAAMQLDHSVVVDWYPSLYSLLVILQLAHVCAMQQTTYLLSRHVDYSQYHSIDDLEEGNNLPQEAMGSRCGLELGQWRCDGARGFTCLSFAIFRQPEVDAGRAPAADVEWFLHAACRLRAYSYIRLCVLPVLRAAYLHDKERGVFYVTVLCELLENLSKVFCMTHYHQLHAHNENDFPYLFFPPTADFFHQNADFYSDQTPSSSRPPLDHQMPLLQEVDSLDDVLSAFTSVLEMRPEFAQVFWPQSGELQHRTLDHLYHPFVMKAVDASYHHPSLILAAIRFVAALSDCPLGRTAYAGYVFVADSSNQRLSWAHFFDCMDRIALQLGAAPPIASPTGTAGQSRFGPLGGGGGGGGGRSTNQQLLPVVRSSAPFHLSDKDVEGLVAIMKLITAVAVHPAAASQLHEAYRPIPRLFALLSCAVPISLKGSILHALSSLARTMPSERDGIWELVESYRLLPHHSSASSAGRKGGPSTAAATAAKGLRIELEESESRLGRYPVTEGFLRLLDALLSHEVPDSSLGRGYRRPGLMVYLDYLIDDLLLKSHERLYAPQEWPCARSQRWRVVALVLKVLCTVLQQYRINGIAPNTVAEAEEALLKSNQMMSQGSSSRMHQHVYGEVVADFREDQMEYMMITAATHNPITASAAPEVSPHRCQRPKTAGFVLMSQLLSRSKLFDYLARLLAESDAQCLEASFEEYCSSEIGVAVDLLQRLYQENHPHPEQQQSQQQQQRADTLLFDFSFSAAAAAGRSHKPKVQAPPPIERLSLSEVGREEHLCDATFWQERALSCAVGLIYECTLRETKFLSFYRSCNTQLTLTRTGEHGRAVVSPVIVHEISDLLSNCITGDSRSVLFLVAQAVDLPIRCCPCLPAVHVLGVRILEHVALHLSAQRLLADLTGHAALDRSLSRADDLLVAGCAAAIRDGYDYSSELNTGCLHYDIVCLGGEMLPVFFSLSSAHTEDREEAAPYNVHLSMINAEASSSLDEGRIDSEYVLSQQQCASMREAVLHLLLTTLTPRCYSLSHRLLGLSASSLSDEQDRLSAVTGEGCLSAVLHILSPDHSSSLGSSFIQQHPAQAVDCFELVYRLSASPLTSLAVLRLLADRHVDFMRGQLTLILYLMHLSDEELLDGGVVTMMMMSGGVESNGYYVVVKAVKAAICTCLGWLLKTCALYLLQSDSGGGAGGALDQQMHRYSEQVLSLLFGSCKQLSFAAERSSDVSVVEKILLYVAANTMDRSETNHDVLLGDPAMQSLLRAATTQQYVGRGGSGWEQHNQFLAQDLSSGSAFLYPVIDVRALGECLRVTTAAASDRLSTMSFTAASTQQRHAAEAVLHSAVLLNGHHKEVAVHAHLLRSLCQLVDVGISTDHLRSTAPDASAIAHRLFDQVFLPVSRALLNERLQEEVLQQPKLKEAYARLILSLVHVFTGSQEGSRPVPLSLSPPQYHRLCRVLLQLLLGTVRVSLGVVRQGMARGRDGLGAVDAVAYRGLLSASLTAVIEAPQRCGRGAATTGTDYAEEDKSQHLDDGDGDDGGDGDGGLAAGRSTSSNGDEYHSIIVQALEERASEVVDVLASDATTKGSSALWRRCSMSALGAVVSALGAVDSQFYSGNMLGKRSSSSSSSFGGYRHRMGDTTTGSFALVQALKLLVQRGYLQSIVDRGIGRLQGMMPAIPEADNDEVFVTCLSLCTHLASCSAEGVEALLASHILDRIVSLSIFLNPPPLPSELSIYAAAEGDDDDTPREVALSRLQRRFFACAALLRSMFAADPLSQTMAACTAKFLSKNSVFVSQIVRLRYLSLDGLAMADAVCSMFAMLAAVPFSERQGTHHPKVPRDNNSAAAGLQLVSYERSVPAPGVWELMGVHAEEFTRDLTMLLGLVGR